MCILLKPKTTLIMVLITNPETIMEMIFNIIIYFTECLSFFIPTTETDNSLHVEMCNYHVSKREGVIFTSDYKGRV